ncbi:hypothetical protein MNBD_ALPHA11-331, partial [hydrothermal vent metagenome]
MVGYSDKTLESIEDWDMDRV